MRKKQCFLERQKVFIYFWSVTLKHEIPTRTHTELHGQAPTQLKLLFKKKHSFPTTFTILKCYKFNSYLKNLVMILAVITFGPTPYILDT